MVVPVTSTHYPSGPPLSLGGRYGLCQPPWGSAQMGGVLCVLCHLLLLPDMGVSPDGHAGPTQGVYSLQCLGVGWAGLLGVYQLYSPCPYTSDGTFYYFWPAGHTFFTLFTFFYFIYFLLYFLFIFFVISWESAKTQGKQRFSHTKKSIAFHQIT